MIVGFEENEISEKSKGGTEITKRRLAAELDQGLLSNFQIVASRMRNLDESKIRIFWAHDLPGDPEVHKWIVNEEERKKFHKFAWSSNWQYQQFMNAYRIPYDVNSMILETWVDPVTSEQIKWANKPKDRLHLFYASTPDRGLDLLIPVYKKLVEDYPDQLHLHIHSSFSIYGWDEQDKQFEPLYDQVKTLPDTTYHGFTPHDELRELINSYHILAFPSTRAETSCRVVMEAMSAGCICVHPNYAALPDTSGGLNWIFHGDMTNPQRHAQAFYHAVRSAIDEAKKPENPGMEQRLMFNKVYIDTRFGLPLIKQKWTVFLQAVLQEVGENRGFPKAEFVYRI